MTSLQEIQQRRAEWKANRATGPQNSLWFRGGDIAFAWFIGTGNDEDPFLEVYLAHELPAVQSGGFPRLIYCPLASGHDPSVECEYCNQNVRLKERMAMWFYVASILHETLPQSQTAQQLPTVQYQGKSMFYREMNRPLFWDTSAWQESPYDEILWIHGQLGNLRSQQVIIRAIGESLKRRYRINLVPNSQPLDDSLLNEHREIIRPVRDILIEQAANAQTVSRPPNIPDVPVELRAGVPQVPGQIPGAIPLSPNLPPGLTPVPTAPSMAPSAPVINIAGVPPQFKPSTPVGDIPDPKDVM